MLSGGLSRSMRINNNLVLDASSSYDEDVFGATGQNAMLEFVWTCLQVSPVVSHTCGVKINSDSSQPLLSLYASDLSSNSTSQFTVTVTSKGRVSSIVVTVIVLSKFAPLITLSSNIVGPKINPGQSLQLTGTIDINNADSVNGALSWSTSYVGFNFASASLTPLKSSVSSLKTTSIVFLSPYTLPQGATLTFSLSCYLMNGLRATSSIVVVVNSPPLPGAFVVSPKVGNELKDLFTFVAQNWFDLDAPLSYQFGFIASGAMVLLAKSETPFGTSLLPAGASNAGYVMQTHADIFDVFNANNSVSFYIVVNPITASASELQNIIASQLSSAVSVNQIKQATAIASSGKTKI